MGNMVGEQKLFNYHKPGEIVSITQDNFSIESGVPNEVLHAGKKAKIVKIVKLLKSRANAPDVYVATVILENGSKEVYLLNNLKK